MDKQAKNPEQQAADEALKIAKKLEDMKNELAKLSHRQEIAAAAGLQQITDAIDRLYELSDRYRTGGVQPLGAEPIEPGVPQNPTPEPTGGVEEVDEAGNAKEPTPEDKEPKKEEKAPAEAAYQGWDPQQLMRHAKPFVDETVVPKKVIQDPAEKFRFDTQQETAPHNSDSSGLAEPE